MELKDILGKCDHTILNQTATWEEVRAVCDDGLHYGCASVCIPASYVAQAAEHLAGRLPVCTVIGFPNGYDTTPSKCFMRGHASFASVGHRVFRGGGRMERNRKESNVLTAVAELFDLPEDVVAGLPRLEMIGSRQLYLERHQGILSYNETVIDVNTSGGILRVEGERLSLLAMTAEELRIGGTILRIEWVR